MTLALAGLIAVALAAVGYLLLERLGRRSVVPAAFRAVAWLALALLLVNPGCPVPAEESRPLVLLDGSLSMTAAGGRWSEALPAARGAGQVRLFGDPAVRLDSVPSAGRSELGPALLATQSGGRAVIVMTDGELDDSLALLPLLRGVGVRLFPRQAERAVAIESVRGQSRLTQRDTLRLRLEVRAAGLDSSYRTAVTVQRGGRSLATAPLQIDNGVRSIEIELPAQSLGDGDHALRVALRDSLAPERRDDERVHLVSVTATPGLVLAASPGDWDSRFLYRTLREVTNLPVEGFVELTRGQWRRMSDLGPVDANQVRQALSRADLAVIRGAPELARLAGRQRAVLEWPTASESDEPVPGDWYLTPGEGPPAGALAGMPVVSFAPATLLLPVSPDSGDWIGATVQAGRRGAPRPAIIGSRESGTRRVTIATQGLWRWAFRGGSSEQAYRALMASLVDWLIAAEDTVRGRARPLRNVVDNGLPVVFQTTGPDGTDAIPIRLEQQGQEIRQTDTLRFDGSGRASLRLAPGVYRYELDGGGRGLVAVEQYSREWFPRPPVLAEAAGGGAAVERRQGLRERWWLFLVAVAALCG
ncbi:MAG TPA: hypothetical protein VFO95_06895, partial [Gemmatimonadales bacterium]|nr:hypothetical protein [Gemmatimonadales bacterium]